MRLVSRPIYWSARSLIDPSTSAGRVQDGAEVAAVPPEPDARWVGLRASDNARIKGVVSRFAGNAADPHRESALETESCAGATSLSSLRC